MLWLALALLGQASGLILHRNHATAGNLTVVDDASIVLPASTQKPVEAPSSSRYLVASFPAIQQVAYVHLPDNVWRPLVIGNVSRPTAVAVDKLNMRLFVADPDIGVIWCYNLTTRDNLLLTAGTRSAAVERYSASELAVGSTGDLYFTGHSAQAPTVNAIWRQTAQNIVRGSSLNPESLYTQSNTGSPNALAWMPFGIAVDALSVYWGNQGDGQTHGTVVEASADSADDAAALSTALPEAGALCVTGTFVFWTTANGVFGVPKSTASPVTDPAQGRVTTAFTPQFNASGLACDSEDTMYVADSGSNRIYSLPSYNNGLHNVTQFADAPFIRSLAILSVHRSVALLESACSRTALSLGLLALASLIV